MSLIDRLANRHFLVVDDEEFVRGLVARFLMRSGAANVVEAADGREAIAAIGSYEMVFDAIICDVKMRPMDGIELLRSIRTGAGGLKRNTPVVMLTAHAEAELVDQALALDANAFVVKPVKREALINRVLRVLLHVVPLQSATHYAAVATNESGEALPALAPAPPTKDLYISIADLAAASTDGQAAEGLAEGAEGSAVAAPQRIPIGKVKPNSILAQNIYILDSPRLLLGAPAILTPTLLDRLKDLRQLHDCYSHVFVIEPATG